jgi:fatty-acyl-CoA synthase
MAEANHHSIEVGDSLSSLTAGNFLREIADRHADREALCFEGRSISYRALEAACERLARGLLGAGVVKGARVAVQLSNRPEWIEAFFAVGSIGAVFVPISTFATRDERDYILRHSDASVFLLQPSLRNHAYLDPLLEDHPELSEGTPGNLRCNAFPYLRRIVSIAHSEPRGSVQAMDELLKLGDDVSRELLAAAGREVVPSDDGIIIYTSGTTARPKAVLHLQRALLVNGLRFSRWMELVATDRVWTAQPFFWTAGITMSLISTLDAGACLILEESFEAGPSLALIESQRATIIHAWAHQQVALAERASTAKRDLSGLRNVGPESPLASHVGSTKEGFGLQASYGLSETFTIFATSPADSPDELRLTTSGKPLPGNFLRIVDPETREPLPTGEFGEIAIKGFTLMRGYYKVDPEDTFDLNGFFGTQDGGFVDPEGHLHWTGRISNMIKTGGANVSPLEIEAALADFEPLKVGLAVGVPHPTLGEAIVLCAVAREDRGPLDEASLRRHLREKVAAYKVPKCVLIVRADELSLTGNQKIAYEPLRKLALARLKTAHTEIDGYRYSDD